MAMEAPEQSESPGVMVDRLCHATNAHDLEALEECFAVDYRNETPVHPARGFQGRAQVRKNWEQIFAAVPDIHAQVRWVADGHEAWSEWEMSGTRRDGAPHLMRGVVLFGVEEGRASWARFYLEPVQEGGGGVDDAVRKATAPVLDGEAGSGGRGPEARP
jgi:ketosteroid isomerase-like protein